MAITASEVERLKVLEREFGIAGTLEGHVGIRYEDYIKPEHYNGRNITISRGTNLAYYPQFDSFDPAHRTRRYINNASHRARFGLREENFAIEDGSPQAMAVSDINSIITHGSHVLGGFHIPEGRDHSNSLGVFGGYGAFVYTNDMKRDVDTYFRPDTESNSKGYFFPVWVDCYMHKGYIRYGTGPRDEVTIERDEFDIRNNFKYSPPLTNFTKLTHIGQMLAGKGMFGWNRSIIHGYALKDRGDFLNDSANETISKHANRRALYGGNMVDFVLGNTRYSKIENELYRFPNAYGLKSGIDIEAYTNTLKTQWMNRIEELIQLRIKYIETHVDNESAKAGLKSDLEYLVNALRGEMRVVKKQNAIIHANTNTGDYSTATRYYIYVVHGIEITNGDLYNKIHGLRVDTSLTGQALKDSLRVGSVGTITRDLESPYAMSDFIQLPATQEAYDALPADNITKAFFPRYKYTRLKGKDVTTESIILAFKEMVMDPMNNLRLRNNNHPARQPYHEFLSDKLFVNYDGVLYTQDDIRYNRLESRRKIAANDPMVFLGNPVTSAVLDDVYLYHKKDYLAGKVPDNQQFVKYVYDIARKLTLGRMEDEVSIKNTLNALGKIASALSCISTLEVLYTDQDISSNTFTPQAFNNPYHSVDNPKLLCKLSRLQAPLVRDIPKLTTTEALKPYYYFAILDPRYALEDVMMKYKDIWTNQILSERKVHELFTKVANDLMNNAVKVRRLVVQVRDAQRGYLENGRWGHAWGRPGYKSFIGSQFWGSSGSSVSVDLNMITREITHVNLEIGYGTTNHGGFGLHFRFSAVNRNTLEEDLRDASGNVINYGNPLAYWNGQFSNGAYRNSGMLELRRSIPPTHMLKMYVYKEGDDQGDAINVGYIHFKGFTFK